MAEEKVNAPEKVEAPDTQKQFTELLVSHKVKLDRAENIARYIAESSEGAVFEDPEILADKLAECHDEIDPVRRRRILRHWFAKKGVEVPEDVMKGIVTGQEKDKLEKKRQKAEEGRLWFVERDEQGVPRLRLGKGEEDRMTLTEAKSALAAMGGAEEPIVEFNKETGRHMPNWKSKFVKSNPMAAWATAREFDKLMAAGEERDPFDIFTDQMAKIEDVKALIGPKAPVATEKTSVVDLVDALVKLDTLRGKGPSLPDWFSDPIKFNETMDKIMERRLPKQDETVSTELKDLRDELKTEREARHKAELDRRDDIIKDQGKRLDRLEEDAKTPRTSTGKTAADLLGDIVQKLPDKSDIRAIPGEVARAIREGERVVPHPPDERERELGEIEGKLKGQAELTRIENWLLFGEK